MPRTKKNKNRNYKKKRNYNKMQITSQIGTNPVSKTQIVKMVYSDLIALDAPSASTANYAMNAGSCFDPNRTGGGHQPMGYDQWMMFYEHYVVLGCKMTCTYWSTGLQPSDGNGVVGITLKADNPGTPWLITRYIEAQGTKYKPLGPVGSTNSCVSVTHKYSPKKFLGRESILSDPELKGTATTSPAESAYFEIFVGPANTGDNLGSVRILIRMEYIVALIEPKPLSQS